MTDKVIVVKGKQINQEQLRKFLEEINFDDIEQFETEDGKWRSPVTGEEFDSKFQLWGQLGAYLRDVEHKDPREPTRAGYVRALRRGLKPTEAQKKAHREYARKYRRQRRHNLLPDHMQDDDLKEVG